MNNSPKFDAIMSLDIFDLAFINYACLEDRCSVSPDIVEGVTLAPACLRHDQAYDEIFGSGKYGFFRRLGLRHRADIQLRKDIIEIGKRAGKDFTALADTYFAAVRICNPFYRLIGYTLHHIL